VHRLLQPVADLTDWERAIERETRRRLRLYQYLEHNDAARAKFIVACKADLRFWSEQCAWSIDDRRPASGLGRVTPFLLWPAHRRLLDAFCDPDADLLELEKSRDTGATYLAACRIAHGFAHRGESFGVMAESGGDVDDRTEKSFLGKVRFLLDHQPPWLRLPYRWVTSPRITMTCPASGGVILGEKARDNAFHGPRLSEVWIDLAMMLLLAVAILPMLHFRGQIGRRRGMTLLAAYLVYVVALFF